MPQVRIELKEGEEKSFLKTLMAVTMDSVQQVLQLPANDRNVRLMEYGSELFSTKPPYKYLIEIMMFAGRTKETKKKLFGAIVDNLHRELKIAKEEVFIIINEQPTENWGIRGGIPADELNLGFKVNI